MRDRDLENFARYFTATLNTGLGHVDKYYERQARTEIAKQRGQQAAIKEAREDRKSEQWIAQSKAYMDYLNKKGAGGGRGSIKIGKPGAGTTKFDGLMAKRGWNTGDTGGLSSELTFDMPAPLEQSPGYLPPAPADTSGGGDVANESRGGRVPERFAGGGIAGGMDLDTAARGGYGGRPRSSQGNDAMSTAKAGLDAGDSPLGRAVGRWAAKQRTPTPAPATGPPTALNTAPPDLNETYSGGGRVQKFQYGGGATPLPSRDYYYTDPVSGVLLRRNPNEAPGAPGGDPYEETRRNEGRAFDAAQRNRTSMPQNPVHGIEPYSGQAAVEGIERQRINEYWRANTPTHGRTTSTMYGPGGGADVDPNAPRDWSPGQAGDRSEPFQHHPDDTHPPSGAAEPPVQGDQVMPAITVSAPRGGGGGGGNEPWKKLGDQTRTAAYHYEKDYGDERNIRAVDRWGRSRQTGPVSAAQPAERGVLEGIANWIGHIFHLDKPDQNSAKGYEALLGGHGAPSIQTIENMRKAVDPEGKLPPNEMIRQLRNEVHKFYMGQGDQAKADKTAFEVSQFGNVMAKSHGANAQKLLAKGDMAGATHEIAAGYNWLPNGHTVSVDPSGKNAVIEGPDGKVVQQIPLTPEVLKQVTEGMAHGVFNWDVMNGGGPLPAPGLNGPQLGPQPDRGGGGGGGQAISPTLPPPVTANPQAPAMPPGRQPWDEKPDPGPTTPFGTRPQVAQPSPAAPAGPPAPPQAATQSSPAAAPTSGGPGGVPGAPAAAPPAVTPTVPPQLTPARTPVRPAPTTVPSVIPGARPQTKPAPQAQTQPSPPSAPAKPAVTPSAQTKPVQPTAQPKVPTPDEEHAADKAALEKKYKDNPDYVPGPEEVPPVRRGSVDQKPIRPQTWDKARAQANTELAEDLKYIDMAAQASGDASNTSLGRAKQQARAEHAEKIKNIEARRTEYDRQQAQLNQQESSRVKARTIKSAAPGTDIHKTINDEFKNAVTKYKQYDPIKESAKPKPADDFAYLHNSPLRYMGTTEAREKLGDIARQIWQANENPDMSEKEAVNHAIVMTSFVSDKKKADSINKETGDKGRYYRAVGWDPLGNVVVVTQGNETVHMPKSTFTKIQNLREANSNKFKQEMKDLARKQKEGVTTSEMLGKTGTMIVKGLAKSPLLPNAKVVPGTQEE